ncbi:polysaccharide deacetylase family protein [Rhizobium sp. KVB221]|uniref:Polysaccharide deacetylase family protein n=1 Tax=Rhizobium setariae TaxID=2801340 RepID=A0A936YPZ7_9HYPH|nr:polysaccharide deacetylase family protein [Rhizobium setariae]MBL0372094.1 polysaccharide deacetylase family protein [Rhizobium setariae]
MRLHFSLSLALLASVATSAQALEKPKQLVIISFDGAHDNKLWERSLKLSEKTGAKFTYFLSCTFVMSQSARKTYQAPHQKRGRSNTGFAQSEQEVRTRLDHLWKAHLAGHEIGSHACGHFDGKDWTAADWAQEFGDFDRTLLAAWKANGAGDRQPAEWDDFVRNDIKGFRVPYLSTGSSLVPALKAHGFAYDASLVSKGPASAVNDDGLMRFALPRVPEGPGGRLVIGMDYNLFVRHSGGLNSPGRSKEFEARTLAMFRNAFEKQYDGERIPLQLGFHFVEMNGGAYWNALDTFLTETCSKPDVACVNYAQALDMAKKKAAGTAF